MTRLQQADALRVRLVLDAATRERLLIACAQTYNTIAYDVIQSAEASGEPFDDECMADAILNYVDVHGGLDKADTVLWRSLPINEREKIARESM